MFKKLLRFGLYGVIVTLFLAFAASAIYYAKGYRYNFHAGRLEKTGLIVLNSKPDAARVTVDTKDHGSKTPTKIDALLPGLHQLTIQKDGYRIWQKALLVEAERATFARYIVLIPEKLSPRRMAQDQAIDSLRVSPDGSQFIYTVSGGSELWRVRSDGSSRTRLFTPQAADVSLASGGTPVNLSLIGWSPDSSRSLVTRTQAGQTSYWLVGFGVTTLDGLLPGDASQIQFDPSDSRRLYFVRAGSLFRLNTADRTISSPILSEVVSYRASDGAIDAIRTSGGPLALWHSDSSGSRLERVKDNLPAGNYALAYTPETDTLAMAGPEQVEIYTPDDGRHRISRVIPGVFTALDWNKNGQRLVYWRSDNVGSFDAQTGSSYTAGTQAGVRAVSWTSDGDHLIISGQDGLTSFTEFDGAYPLTFKALREGTLAYLPGLHELVYLDGEGKLYRVDLRRT